MLINLTRSNTPFPLFNTGLIKKDSLKKQILESCQTNKIDAHHIARTSKAQTSYTNVMTEQGHRRRTFFHARGTNALWNGDDLNFEKSKARIFHIGYLLLLNTLDQPNSKFGTKATHLLTQTQATDMKTSVDVVSEDSNRFA